MLIENFIPSLLIAIGLIAIGSVALVQFIYGRTDLKLSMYTFVLVSLTVSTFSLKWLEGSGHIHSSQDNTNIFVLICLLLAVSIFVSRRLRGLK